MKPRALPDLLLTCYCCLLDPLRNLVPCCLLVVATGVLVFDIALPAVFVCRAGGAQQSRQAVQARAEMHVLEVASRKRQEEARQAKSRDEHAA